MVSGLTPVEATTTLPLKPEDFSSRSIQPSKPRPLTKKISRAGQHLGVGGGRLEDVGIAIGWDQGDHLDAVAADLAHHVAENAERGYGLELVGRLCAAGKTEQDGERQPDLPYEAILHGTNSFHWGIRLPDACAERGDR